MAIRARLDELSWPLAAANARHQWSERRVVMLALELDGHTGLGEHAPLPGYSADDLDGGAEELRAAVADLGWAANVGDKGPSVTRALLLCAAQRVRSAAARFALETALLDLRGRALGVPVWSLVRELGGPVREDPPAVELSGLIRSREPLLVAEEAREALARGLRVLKVKIGGAPLEDDRLRLEAAAESGAVLRLDANQSLGTEGFFAAAPLLASFAPELVEEPVRTEAWEGLDALGLHLAMDESLQAPGAEERVARAAARGAVSALVLKPMALGGIVRCLELADLADRLGLGVVVTHLFDGPVATAAAADLALALRGRVLACGLDLHGRTEHWPEARFSRVGVAAIACGDAPGLGVELGPLRSAPRVT